MINLNSRLLPETQAKEILAWARTPAGQLFTNYLAQKAAEWTAKAGNALMDGDQSSVLEAQQHADVARKFLGAHELMSQMYDPSFQFEVADLTPKPLTIVQ